MTHFQQSPPTPGVIASFEAMEGINFKTMLGSVLRYDDPASNGVPPFVESMSMHYWHMKAGELDNQKPHFQDEVYVILEGKGAVKVDGKTSEVSRGDIIFVPAKMEHNFIANGGDMRILIFFAPNWDGKPAG